MGPREMRGGAGGGLLDFRLLVGPDVCLWAEVGGGGREENRPARLRAEKGNVLKIAQRERKVLFRYLFK